VSGGGEENEERIQTWKSEKLAKTTATSNCFLVSVQVTNARVAARTGRENAKAMLYVGSIV
jgi:hypothetical protein